MKFKKNIKVMPGIPHLKRNDKYKPFLKQCIKHIKEQKCQVKTMEPYITPQFNGKFKEGELSRLQAITDRLNNLIDKFIQTDASHLWIVDGDIEVPSHALCELLSLDADISSGIYCFHNDSRATMFGRMPNKETYMFAPRDIGYFRGYVLGENERVGGGNGCMLIKRRVFKRYHPQIPALRFTCPQGKGSDIYFWYRAQKAGFTARITGNVICGHLPEHPLKTYEEF